MKEEGKAALELLTRNAQERSRDATPLGAFVKYIESCQSVDDVKSKCTSLIASG